jgi:tetratricopeptide (TPR) repeat protein
MGIERMSTTARIDELRAKFDENPRRYFAPLANEYRKAGELAQAIAICREHLPRQPGHMSGHIVLGQALFEQAELDDARAVFESALALDPENLIALRHLGDIARLRGDASAARRWYGRVLDADPRNDDVEALLGALPARVTPPSAAAVTTARPVFAAGAPAAESLVAPSADAAAGGGATGVIGSSAALEERLQSPGDSGEIELLDIGNAAGRSVPGMASGVIDAALDAFASHDPIEEVSRAEIRLGDAVTAADGSANPVLGFSAARPAVPSEESQIDDALIDAALIDADLLDAELVGAGRDWVIEAPLDTVQAAGFAPVAADEETTLEFEAGLLAADWPETEALRPPAAPGAPEAPAAVPSRDTDEMPGDMETPDAVEVLEMLEVVATPDAVEVLEMLEVVDTPDAVEVLEMLEVVATPDAVEVLEMLEVVDSPDAAEVLEMLEVGATPDAVGVLDELEVVDTPADARPGDAVADATWGDVTEPVSAAADADEVPDAGRIESDIAADATPGPLVTALDEDPPLSAAEMSWLSVAEEEREAEVTGELLTPLPEAELPEVTPAPQALDLPAADSPTPESTIPEAAAPEAAAPEAAFVTETMAELLVAQGFVARAIEVYAELVRRRPDDDRLAGRLAELQASVSPVARVAAVTVSDDAAAVAPLSGQDVGGPRRVPFSAPAPRRTARAWLADLASRQVHRPVPRVTPVSSAPPTPAPLRPTMTGQETPADGLALLFGAVDSLPPDELRAAESLAHAFGAAPERDGAGLFDDLEVGDPAERWEPVPPSSPRPLGTAETVEPDAFSFERFFPDPGRLPGGATAASVGGTASPSASGPRPEAEEAAVAPPRPASPAPIDPTQELAQFASWLKGLGAP